MQNYSVDSGTTFIFSLASASPETIHAQITKINIKDIRWFTAKKISKVHILQNLKGNIIYIIPSSSTTKQTHKRSCMRFGGFR